MWKFCKHLLLHFFSGSYDKGIVEVTNAFAVPHNESEDEVINCALLKNKTQNKKLPVWN